ncbi:uncharacterized protein LAJ45_01673 [Morchella importuna]|uniref:uncharacterized protein n=1 Tax=Morchella importuna TaxID=1174673 RepID=UPI001E8E32D3|nr:uncharacterized protein LAJ45_01673 [Morchella importuna]KAH8153906.1 hypothetical protein LAJ45_01673 [Morchella importuna]
MANQATLRRRSETQNTRTDRSCVSASRDPYDLSATDQGMTVATRPLIKTASVSSSSKHTLSLSGCLSVFSW